MKLLVIGAHLERGDIEPLARPVAVADLFLSALEIAGDQPLGDRELLLKVARVRSELLQRSTFIAVRYGFAAGSESEAADKCAPHAGRWRALLERHRNEVEMTLKVVAAGGFARPDRRSFRRGADYLKALHAAVASVEIDPSFRAGVERRLLPLASAQRWIVRDGGTVELAMIVHRDSVEQTYAAGEDLRTMHPNVPFLLSGPWPLEVFAE